MGPPPPNLSLFLFLSPLFAAPPPGFFSPYCAFSPLLPQFPDIVCPGIPRGSETCTRVRSVRASETVSWQTAVSCTTYIGMYFDVGFFAPSYPSPLGFCPVCNVGGWGILIRRIAAWLRYSPGRVNRGQVMLTLFDGLELERRLRIQVRRGL